MSNVKKTLEMLVLGMLSENPQHAYQLRRSIESAVGNTQRVSDGFLYPLLKELAAAGLISGTIEAGKNAPERRVYHLESAGASRLRKLLCAPLECIGFSDTVDFYARFALFKNLSPEERLVILRERLAACDAALGELSKTAGDAATDLYRLELIERIVGSIDDECFWLAKMIERESALCGERRRASLAERSL